MSWILKALTIRLTTCIAFRDQKVDLGWRDGRDKKVKRSAQTTLSVHIFGGSCLMWHMVHPHELHLICDWNYWTLNASHSTEFQGDNGKSGRPGKDGRTGKKVGWHTQHLAWIWTWIHTLTSHVVPFWKGKKGKAGSRGIRGRQGEKVSYGCGPWQCVSAGTCTHT